ncbi:T9SS type A sorting domain-containing protein [Chryseobacterium balustinum]|uniref:Por secretion system C-terminal sorting domain n=1 Tax=Chryseobacterium balustinum TaxID=246 RepID=A0AAX2INW3_9FLAO|nr:T9SS type A sorting domain-containing protein [Chryseobacterium balustinum]AZB30004.1 T9SS C-terminal target domain-containing protein [Chryseobacterium balustinum]SKC04992.1 Por secretion system C-terminal sorting domain-containing protein [Chryseobacterium balustinum]SQA91701.1 Por secretion system C-terminal sorting domain [Chryseobacterium balustinum]
MKTKLLLGSLFALTVQQTILAQVDANGYTTVNMSMGASYQNRVFFDLSTNNTVTQPANTWDVAFYRNATYGYGTRINDALNIKVYEASNNLSNWDNINIANLSSWGAPLYNPDQTTALEDGAFEQGSAPTGWGQYNGGNHHVEGKIIFVIQYPDNSYIKFAIEDYYGGYTFKYSKWNATTSTWGTTETRTLANGTDDAYFNYFSFTTGAKVENMEPPKVNWDLMFTRYYTFYMNYMMYQMSGVLQSPTVSIAKVQPETQATATATIPVSTAFSNNITTIGHSWKPTSGFYNDVVYYIKQGSEYYRMYFISNEGTATGNMYFKYKNITSTLGITEVSKKASFGIYPNPTTADKKVTVLFDVKEKANNKGSVEVYDLTGKRVYNAELSNQTGFYKQDLNLSHLASGNYLVKITYGGKTETKKLIVK